jgi:hypothetical protein
MISRIALTLTLASSLAATAAETGEKCPLGYNTKLVAGLAAASGFAAIAYGTQSGHPEATAIGIGALTGFGCAALEHYTQHYVANNKLTPWIMATSWTAERSMRTAIMADMSLYTPNNVTISRLTSWASYALYRAARNIDNN